MSSHIIETAKRCLNCKIPQCKKGCPVNTPIPDIIKLLLENDIKQAGEILFKNNPMSVICSLVCPHENQCEGNCILGKKGDPVQISEIEHYISNYYLDVMNLVINNKNKLKVAIIGSGPAGITIAFILALKGYDITIFEAHDKIGGVLRYGIPEFRLPKSILDKIYNNFISLGVKIRPNVLIGKNVTIDELFRDEFKAIFIGTGVWNARKLNIKGESLANVHYAIDYLKNPSVYNLGNSLCVIGAGNVAIDVARTAIRKGVKNVTVMYRKGFDAMSASKYEIEYAKIDGVKFELHKTPIELKEDGILYKDSIDDSTYFLSTDSIIVAIGQGPKSNIVDNNKGIAVSDNGLVITDKFGRTTRDGVFCSGDVVTGAKTVVEAVRISKLVAEAMDEYIRLKVEQAGK